MAVRGPTWKDWLAIFAVSYALTVATEPILPSFGIRLIAVVICTTIFAAYLSQRPTKNEGSTDDR